MHRFATKKREVAALCSWKNRKKKKEKKDHESKNWYCVEPKISTNRSKNNHSIHTVCEMPSIFRRQCYIQPNVSVIRVIPHTKRESWISIVAIDQLHNLCLPNFYSINIKSIHEIFIRADRIFYQKSSDFSLFTIKTINYRQIKQTVFPLLPFNFHLSIRANEGIPSSSSLRLLQIKNFENKIYTSTELPSFNSSIIHTSLLPRPTQKFHSLSRMNRSSFPPSLPPGNPHRPSSTRKETKETNPLPSPPPKARDKIYSIPPPPTFLLEPTLGSSQITPVSNPFERFYSEAGSRRARSRRYREIMHRVLVLSSAQLTIPGIN